MILDNLSNMSNRIHHTKEIIVILNNSLEWSNFFIFKHNNMKILH